VRCVRGFGHVLFVRDSKTHRGRGGGEGERVSERVKWWATTTAATIQSQKKVRSNSNKQATKMTPRPNHPRNLYKTHRPMSGLKMQTRLVDAEEHSSGLRSYTSQARLCASTHPAVSVKHSSGTSATRLWSDLRYRRRRHNRRHRDRRRDRRDRRRRRRRRRRHRGRHRHHQRHHHEGMASESSLTHVVL
jgi:hypothetical protein